MDINDAVRMVEGFLEDFRARGAWQPEEIRVHPSGDDADHIKIWFGFPARTAAAQLDALKQQPIDALRKAHPELAEFTLEVRAEVI